MPDFDKVYMPPSVSVDGDSMFDDQIAFALMAENVRHHGNRRPPTHRIVPPPCQTIPPHSTSKPQLDP